MARKPIKTPKVKKPQPASEDLGFASLCGILSRACVVLNIPWRHEDNIPAYESQIKAFSRWLSEKQFPAEAERVDKPVKKDTTSVEVPFGA